MLYVMVIIYMMIILVHDTVVYLDVEDIVQASGTECNVQSVSAIFGFNNANAFADLAAHLGNVLQPSYGQS